MGDAVVIAVGLRRQHATTMMVLAALAAAALASVLPQRLVRVAGEPRIVRIQHLTSLRITEVLNGHPMDGQSTVGLEQALNPPLTLQVASWNLIWI